MRTVLFLAMLPFAFITKSDKEIPAKLRFTEGASYHVQIDEMLRLIQQFSQVDSVLVEPSSRFSTYHITENIVSVNPDGSAHVAATFDSITTMIYVGEITPRNEYFRFNSNSDYDVGNRLKDIRALPRAQFLGQTIRYVIGTDGRIDHFENLSSFQEGIIARAYEYDMLHALLSFTDSLRLSQLLDQGSGAIGAIGKPTGVTVPYTVTEIHLQSDLSATATTKAVEFSGSFKNPPAKIDYLEGIAFPIAISNFQGGLRGHLELHNGYLSSLEQIDSASMILSAESESIHSSVYRTLSVKRSVNEGVYGKIFNVKEIKQTKKERDPADSMITIPLTAPRKH